MESILTLKEISLEIRKARKTLNLTQKKLAFLAGISQAALARIEKNPEKYNPGYATIHQIVKTLSDELMKAHPKNFENMKVLEIAHSKIVSIKPTDSFRKAIELMKGKSFSQLPVIDENNAVLGTIYQRQLADIVFDGKNPSQIKVLDIMEPALPQIDKNTPLSKVKSFLQSWPAVLITEKQKVIGIVTSYDWFKVV